MDQTEKMRRIKSSSRNVLRKAKKGYAAGEVPFEGYLTLLGIYMSAVGAASLALNKRGTRLPEKISASDLALLSVGSHKLTRMIVRDWVLSPLRAPFVKYSESIGAGEVVETSRGHAFKKAFGDLISCPWCAGVWVTTAMGMGFLANPKVTRYLAGLLTVNTFSDYLQIVYDLAKSAERKWA